VQRAVVSTSVLLEGSREAHKVVAGGGLSKAVRESVTLSVLDVRSYFSAKLRRRGWWKNLQSTVEEISSMLHCHSAAEAVVAVERKLCVAVDLIQVLLRGGDDEKIVLALSAVI
jgi:hypothetical protein